MTESWCLVSVNGQQIKANIVHKGNGKFEIIEAEDDRHIGKIVDASEVNNCKVQK